MSTQSVIEKLLRVFPPRTVGGEIAPHDCPTCQGLREQLTGGTWPEVPAEFIRDRPDVLPLLAHDAYLAFLPAWLREGVLRPDGEVAGMLLVHLGHQPNTTDFTPEQCESVIEVARFIAENDYWGPEDAENVKSLAEVEHFWSGAAD